MPTWDPQHYLTYAGERGRPFVDLLAQVGADAPGTVVDLGCGPGNMTRLLADRWPGATVTGVDSSADMIRQARAEQPDLTWVESDLRDWHEPADVVFSNAAFQWLPEHLELLPSIAALAGEWLAFQVPGNLAAPSATLPDQLAASGPYAEYTASAEQLVSHDPLDYFQVLTEAEGGGRWDVDTWETTYLHLLRGGPDAVFDWFSGTGLRPVLEALPDDLREQYVAELKPQLRAAYPMVNGVVPMTFRRVFVVARRR